MNQGQVITVKGETSEWYEEAVFVLRDGVNGSYVSHDLCKEAERIIGNHAKKNGLAPARGSNIDQVLNLILFATVFILGMCLIQL